MSQRDYIARCRPKLKTRGLSGYHIRIFELVLLQRSTKEINQEMGYSVYSHAAVDHSRKVMHKLLALEDLPRKLYEKQITYPRAYSFWWKKLLEKHRLELLKKCIEARFYE